MATLNECIETATSCKRTWNCWIMREPSGNYYTTSSPRGTGIASKADRKIAVVRRGHTIPEWL